MKLKKGKENCIMNDWGEVYLTIQCLNFIVVWQFVMVFRRKVAIISILRKMVKCNPIKSRKEIAQYRIN